MHTRNKKLLYLFLTLIAFSVQASTLPDLGDPSENALSLRETQELSQSFMQELQQENQIIGDPLLNDYLNNLGKRLIQHSNNPTQDISYILIANPAINAFAGPSDIVGIFTGLFSTTKNESEVAAVMAHETAHVLQHHLLRTIAKAKHLQIPMLLSSLAAIAISTQNANLGQGALIGSMAGFQQDMINFTRSNEKEADRIGIDMLYHAQFNPNSMADFFKRLQDSERLYYSSKTPDLLRTHPVTESRIADAKNRAAQWPKKLYSNSLLYSLMKQRSQVITSVADNSLLTGKRTAYTMNPSDPVAVYAYALTLLKFHKTAEAQPLVNQLIKLNPDELIYQLLANDYYVAIKDLPQAIKSLSHAYFVHPSSYPLIIEYGKTLLQANQAAQAEKILQQAVYNDPQNITYLLLLAEAQAATQQKAAAYFSKARALLISGEPEYAYDQLKIAKKMAKNDYYLLLQIKALQHEINPEGNKVRDVIPA